jgi:hypothetical protein
MKGRCAFQWLPHVFRFLQRKIVPNQVVSNFHQWERKVLLIDPLPA